eukprot:CAMPEP_0170489504 /NCGR_PEP_ID=MMETSP0208-20121228/7860_1 /TAXON_ID=197538 /ORGANISM="Strombidium inclinatum, Strain S3" /LENGTH=93 /DNA_ID=CAMNT_0010764465 /DNA_START=603 /DNA_END=884 /DNA_ORIENTATION=-
MPANPKARNENGANPVLGKEGGLSSKFFSDHLGNYEPKADTVSIDLPRRVEAPEQLEQLTLIALSDANPIIENREDNSIMIAIVRALPSKHTA